jgi:hypothetical protein
MVAYCDNLKTLKCYKVEKLQITSKKYLTEVVVNSAILIITIKIIKETL